MMSLNISDVDETFFNDRIPELMSTGRDDSSVVYESMNMAKDGSMLPVEVSSSIIRYDGSDVYLSMVRDITERRQTEETQKQLMDELVKSNAELQQFAYVASHDLQEPLRMVASYVQLLERRYHDILDDDARDFIEFASDGASRMQLMIDDLLEYSRVDTAGHAFSTTSTEKAMQIATINLKEAIEESGVEITHDPLPTIEADQSQIIQVLQNLLANSIKFRGQKKPLIHVSADQDDGEWIFSVSDNGIGIEEQYGDRIFTIFQRLHGREEYPGTGIGLAVCKRIMERHQGRIWFDSEPGSGTTFNFSIPLTFEEIK